VSGAAGVGPVERKKRKPPTAATEMVESARMRRGGIGGIGMRAGQKSRPSGEEGRRRMRVERTGAFNRETAIIAESGFNLTGAYSTGAA
jgi:hypothetical protein